MQRAYCYAIGRRTELADSCSRGVVATGFAWQIKWREAHFPMLAFTDEEGVRGAAAAPLGRACRPGVTFGMLSNWPLFLETFGFFLTVTEAYRPKSLERVTGWLDSRTRPDKRIGWRNWVLGLVTMNSLLLFIWLGGLSRGFVLGWLRDVGLPDRFFAVLELVTGWGLVMMWMCQIFIWVLLAWLLAARIGHGRGLVGTGIVLATIGFMSEWISVLQ